MNAVQHLYSLIPDDKKPDAVSHMMRVKNFIAERTTLLLSISRVSLLSAELCACELWGIEHSQLLSSTRKHRAVCARAFMYNYMYNSLKWTYEDIARYYKRNHASILHARGMFDDMHLTDKNFRAKFAEFQNQIILISNNDKQSKTTTESHSDTGSTPTDVLVHRTVDN